MPENPYAAFSDENPYLAHSTENPFEAFAPDPAPEQQAPENPYAAFGDTPVVKPDTPVTPPGAPQAKQPVRIAGPAMADFQGKVEDFTKTPTFDKVLAEDNSRKMTVGGAAVNTLKSGGRVVRDIAKGVLTAPVAGTKAAVDLGAEIQRGYHGGAKELAQETGRELLETAGQVGDSLIDKYAQEFYNRNGLKPNEMGGHGAWIRNPDTGKMEKDSSSVLGAIGRRLYKDPVGTLLDFVVIKDLMAAGTKSIGRHVEGLGDAKAALAAEKAMGMRPMGPKAIELGLEGAGVTDTAGVVPNPLQKAGKAIQDVAGKAETIGTDTLQAGQDAIAKGVYKAGNKLATADLPGGVNALGRGMEALGSENPQLERKLTALRGEEYSRAPAMEKVDLDQLMPAYRNLSPKGRTAVGDVMLLGEGANPSSVRFFMTSPEAQTAYSQYMDWIGNTREQGLSDLGLLNPKIADQRVALQYAKMKGWDLQDPSRIAQAKSEIAAMNVKPLYVPSGHELKGSFDLTGALNKVNDGTVGYLEAYKGQKGHSNDPLVFIPRAIKAFRKTEADMRFLRRITADPEMVRAVTEAEALAQSGGQDLQRGIQDKYLLAGPKERAQGVYQREIQAKYGDAAKDMLLNDPDTVARWKEVSKVVANPAIKRILDMEFTSAQGGARVMLDLVDGMNNLFRKAAVRLNPHYVTGNAVGDALFSIMAGVSPKQVRLGNKLRAEGKMPYQALGTASVNNTGNTGIMQRMHDYAMDVDAATRGGIIVKEVGKKLKGLGYTAAEFEKRAGEIMGSIERLSQGELEGVTTQENLAKKLGSVHKARSREAKDPLPLISPAVPASEKAAGRFGRAFDKAADQERLTQLNAKDAKLLRDAIRLSNQWVGDYHGAGPVEQYVFRRAYPFLPFQKAMLGLSFKIAAVAPRESAILSRFAAMMDKQIEDDKNPASMKGFVKFGKNLRASAGSLSPFEGTTIEGAVMPEALDPRAHPVVSTLPGMTNKYRSPYGGDNVVGKNGKQYEAQEDGTEREVEADRPILEKLGNFAPVFPRLEKLIAQPIERAVTGKAYGVFSPVTDQKNPKGLLRRLGESFGVKINDSKENIARVMEKKAPLDALEKEIMRLQQIVASPKATPEEKAEARRQIADRKAEGKRFIKAGGKQTKE